VISFKSDYAQGAHPRLIEALVKFNMEHNDGYGADQHSKNAVRFIQERVGGDCFVTLMAGGTLANLTVISHALRQHHAVISADTGHIFTNETGAVEATGHKVIPCAGKDGKLTAEMIQKALDNHTHIPHVVRPKLVYISHPTELGTLYGKNDLTEISALCKQKGLYLYIDGARLGCALAAQKDELNMADLAALADAFTAGGTKNGALFGEAVIIPNKALAEDFLFSVRQKGGLLARGGALGIQFEELFKDDLYIQLGGHANKMARILKEGLTQAGFEFLVDSPTNQQFVYIDNKTFGKLSEKYLLRPWKRFEERTLVRLVTSWATKEEEVREFLEDVM